MAHAIVDLGDPEPRQLIVGIGGRNLLKRHQRLGVLTLLRELNRGRQVGGNVVGRGLRGGILRQHQEQKRKQHPSGSRLLRQRPTETAGEMASGAAGRRHRA